MSAGLSSALLAGPPPPPSFFLPSFLAGAWPLATDGAPSAAEAAEAEAASAAGCAAVSVAAEVEGAAAWVAELAADEEGAAEGIASVLVEAFGCFGCLLGLLALTYKAESKSSSTCYEPECRLSFPHGSEISRRFGSCRHASYLVLQDWKMKSHLHLN